MYERAKELKFPKKRREKLSQIKKKEMKVLHTRFDDRSK